MIITAPQHHALSTHLVVTVLAGDRRIWITAPQAVYMAIAALVTPEEIRGSHATYTHLRPTRWRVCAVTSTHLAFVELEFDGEDYDAEEERKRLNPERRGYREPPASAMVVSAWARPLATALTLRAAEISRDHPIEGAGSVWAGSSSSLRTERSHLPKGSSPAQPSPRKATLTVGTISSQPFAAGAHTSLWNC